jgi:hypothetical protein
MSAEDEASRDSRVVLEWHPSITCPICRRISYSPADIEQRYCGACHRFHDEMNGELF